MRALLLSMVVLAAGCGGEVAPQRDATSSSSGSSAGSSSAAASSSSGTSSGSSSSSSSASSSSAGTSSGGSSSSTSSTSSSGSSSSGTSGSTGAVSALLRPNNPMPCADPAVISETNAGQTFYVFCTGMAHVWKTTDWTHFSDVRSATTFDVSAMSTNGKEIGSWWAPGIVYAPGLALYVMWVSVPDALGTKTAAAGWDTRSLAVLTAPTLPGPWTFQGLGVAATAVGQHYIDPYPFRDHDGSHYVFWKQYGGGISSSIMAASVTASWGGITASSKVEVMHGYGGTGTWEDNVRENPAVWYDPATGHHHLIFSGGHWADDSYGTGHAVSACGPLCVGSGGWTIVSSGDRGIDQAVQSNGVAAFASGGPGGAEFFGAGTDFVYAAAAKSASQDSTRYLMRDAIRWRNDAPFVDTAHHKPEGF